jgi:hypothetical protein
MSSIFEDAGFTLPKADTAPVAATPATQPIAPSTSAPQSIFSAAGFDIPTKAAPVPASPIADNIPTPAKFAADYEAHKGTPEKSTLQKVREAIDPVELGTIAAKNAAADIAENAAAGWRALKQGASEIGQGNLAPSYAGPGQPGKSTDLTGKTTDVAGVPQFNPGGILRAVGGAVEIPASLITGPTNALVSRPVTELTGNPEIGNRAGFVANALLPVKGGGKVAEVAAPETKAVDDLVNAIGAKNVPEAVSQLRANPRLTLADVSAPVRSTVQGAMVDGTPAEQDFIDKAITARNATKIDATNSAFTEAIGPTPDVNKILTELKNQDAGPAAALKSSREGLDSVMGPAGDPHTEIQALRERQEAAVSPQATKGTLDQSMGRATDPYDELHQMMQERSTAAAPLYAKALDNHVVWDGRLQQFLDDPIVKQGLSQGVRIQRLESLAANEPFRPSDYAIKSFNEAGDPIIGETPNMRTLNVVKKGLDAKVQEMTDPVTGRLSEEGRAVNEVRKSFLNKLDDINPDYKAARQAWAGPSQTHDAFNRGLNVFQNRAGSSGVNTTPSALNSWFNGASEAEKEASRIGARSAFDQQMKSSGDQTAKVAALANKEVNRDKLNVLFGRDQANRLVERLNATHEDPIGGGFTRGLDLFQNKAGSAGVESTPEALSAWHKNASPEAQQAARTGARTAVDQQMKAATDPAVRGAALANKEINREKLAVLFGKEGADKIVGHLNSKFEDPVHDAFQSGFDVLKNRSGIEGLQDRPAALADWMKTATPEQIAAKRLGARLDIDQKIKSVKNGALAGQTVTAIPYNQEKLQTLFGEPEANRLIRVMEDSQKEAETNFAITKGSETARRTAAAARRKVRDVGGGNPLQYVAPVAAEILGQSAGLPFVGLAGSLAAKGLHMGAQKIGQMHDIARNQHFTENALSSGVAREQTINALLSHPKVISELKKRANAVTTP